MGDVMTIVLVCPKCRNHDKYENNDLDASKEITCCACGFSELPTAFELAKSREKKSWQVAKIVIIIVAGIAFSLVGLFVIALAAFFVPIVIAAVIVVILYQRWKAKKSTDLQESA